MKCNAPNLVTPLYLKLDDAMPWPEGETVFHLLTNSGLFLCRNTPFLRSCVRVEDFPSELAGQEEFLKLAFPKIPSRMIEQVVGFFDIIGERYGSEACVLVAWNRETRAIEIIVPEQVGIVGTGWSGKPYPLELEYQIPTLPPPLVLLGDIHSHVDGAAYSSYLDKSDERYRPGWHLVVGRILDEPPQFHCEATADGARFLVKDLSLVLERYGRRRVDEVPEEWIEKVSIKPWTRTRSLVESDSNWASPAKGSLWKANPEAQALTAEEPNSAEQIHCRQPPPV